MYRNDQSFYYTIGSFNQKFRTNPGICILNYNIRSFAKNSINLESLLDSLDTKPSVIVLTETFLNSSNATLFKMSHYRHVSSYNPDERNGGVSIFVSTDIEFKSVDVLSSFTRNMEMCSVELQLFAGPVVIVAVYRLHGGNIVEFDGELEEALQSSCIASKKVYVVGDFNIDLMKHEDSHTINFVSTMQSHSFVPLITLSLIHI